MTNCINCGLEIKKKGNFKYCGDRCNHQASYKRKKVNETKLFLKKCPICKNTFNTKIEHQIYCSKECKLKIKTNLFKNKICPICNKSFLGSIFKIYCSKECVIISLHNRTKILSKKDWFCLREQCLENNNYSCFKCNSDNKLVCHHIIPKCFGGSDDISNLTILCIDCHAKEHNNLSKKNKEVLK